jgi:hypothetical protein
MWVWKSRSQSTSLFLASILIKLSPKTEHSYWLFSQLYPPYNTIKYNMYTIKINSLSITIIFLSEYFIILLRKTDYLILHNYWLEYKTFTRIKIFIILSWYDFYFAISCGIICSYSCTVSVYTNIVIVLS